VSNSSNLALLLIAYRRVETVGHILEISSSSGVKNVYVVIDKSPRDELVFFQEEIVSLCEKYRSSFSTMHIIERRSNVGCAASVMTGIEWVFHHEDFLCILEDDCIPTPDFFAFVRATRNILESDDDVLLVCGTQFAPKTLSNGRWVKSKYALTWGWATTKKNWSVIRSNILSAENSPISTRKRWSVKRFLDAEDRYWNSGARRARRGYVDVWDTVLLQVMRERKKYAILPAESLVTNVGDDTDATHTKSSEWTHKSTGTFLEQHRQPSPSSEIDQWLERHFFRISRRHLISTRITQLIDLFRTPLRPPLQDQFQNNQISEL